MNFAFKRAEPAVVVKSPLYDLVYVRNNLPLYNKDSNMPPEFVVLQSIPILDKPTTASLYDSISKGGDAEALLLNLKFFPKFDIKPVAELQCAANAAKTISEGLAVAACVFSMSWIYASAHGDIELEILIDILNKCTQVSIAKIVGFCFSRLIQSSVLQPPFCPTVKMVQLIIIQIYANRSIEVSFYPQLLTFIKATFNTGDTDSIHGVVALIEQLVTEHRPAINYHDTASLVYLLHELMNARDPTAMRILCRLTQLSKQTEITDGILLIPISFVNFLAGSKPSKSNIIDTTLPLASVPQDIEVSFEFPKSLSCTLSDGILAFPSTQSKEKLSEMADGTLLQTAIDISEALILASDEAQEKFIQNFCHFMKAFYNQPQFLDFFTAFLLIVQKIESKPLLNSVIQSAFKSPLFSESVTIFHQSRVSPFVNLLRNDFLSLLLTNFPEIIISIISTFSVSPYLYTEMLIRVTELSSDWISLVKQTDLSTILDCAVKMQRMNDSKEVLYAARSAITSLACELSLSQKFFSAQSICRRFIYFVFEGALTQSILFSVQMAISNFSDKSASNLAHSLSEAMNACISHFPDEAYIRTAELIAISVLNGLSDNESISRSFEPFIASFSKPTKKLLSNLLSLYSLYIRTFEKFKFPIQELINLLSLIQSVYADDPPISILLLLFAIMRGGNPCDCNDNFLITVPSALPLIIAAFSSSSNIKFLINRLLYLCRYSDFNARSCHDGDLDLILIQFAIQQKENAVVDYRGLKIKFLCDPNLVMKLFFAISSIKSSNAIASTISRNLSDPICIQLTQFFLTSRASPSSFLGWKQSCLMVEGVEGTSLNTGFSISFLLRLDLPVLRLARLEFLSISDTSHNILKCYIEGASIFVSFESTESRTSVVVVRNPPSCSWDRYTMVFTISQDRSRISTYKASEALNDSDLCPIVFSEGELHIEFGCTGNGIQVGYLGSTMLFLSKFSQREVHALVNSPYSFRSVPLFDTSNVKHHVSQNNSKIIVSEGSAPKVPKNLISVIERNQVNNMAAGFTQDFSIKTLNLLEIIFRKSIYSQTDFSMTNRILTALSTSKKVDLSFNLYIAFFETFLGIEQQSLRNEWFDMLILNIWLWSKSQEFEMIVFHWSKEIPIKCSSQFLTKSYFPRLLDQFRIFFCGAQQKASEECRKLFVLLLMRVASINFGVTDSSYFFDTLLSVKDKSTLLILLQIAGDISGSILKSGFTSFPIMNLLSSEDIDIAEMAFIALHQLSIGCSVSRFMSACNIRPKKELFIRLLSKLAEYPNFVIYLCITSIAVGMVHEMAESLAKVTKFDICDYWFISPMILAFNACQADRQFIIKFLSSQIILSKNKGSELEQLIFFALYVSSITNLPSVEVATDILLNLNQADEEFSFVIAKLCFTTALFHFSINLHSSELLLLFSKSEFNCVYEEPSPPTKVSKLSSIEDLKNIANSAPKLFSMKFEAHMNDNLIWNDKGLRAPILSSSDPRLEQMKAITLLLSSHDSIDSDLHLHISGFLFEFISTTLEEHSKQISDSLALLCSSVFSLLQPSNTSLKSTLIPLDREERLAKSIIDIGVERERKLIRDRSICIYFSPMKLKIFQKKKKLLPPIVGDPITEFHTSLITVKGQRECQFKVFKDRIFIISPSFSKAFTTFQVRVVFTRLLKGKETGLEFFLSDGRSYLLDFAPSDSGTVLKSMSKVQFPEANILQTQTVSELIDEASLTHDWRYGIISNFEYLSKLNAISGRSFNSLELYPFFPSILSSFAKKTFRDLTKSFEFTNLPFESPLSRVEASPIIPPEYFFLPSALKDIPKWAKDKFEFVYNYHKLLESKEVTSNLHMWIDFVWGPKKKGFNHRALFTKSHPPYANAKRPKVQNSEFEMGEMSIEFCCLLKAQRDGMMEFLTLTSDGRLGSIMIKISDLSFSMEDWGIIIDPQCSKNASNKGAILMTESEAAVIREGKGISRFAIFFETGLCCYCDSSFIYCSDECSIAYVADKVKEPKPLIICRSESRIISMAASSSFKIVAYSTINKTINVHSLKSGAEVGVVRMEEEIGRLIVTQTWGFVVGKSEQKLILLSPNGELIKKIEMRNEITEWFTFSTSSGFDYVIFEDSNHKVGFFEAFYPEKIEYIEGAPRGISTCAYEPISSSIVFITKSGKVTLIQIQIPQKPQPI